MEVGSGQIPVFRELRDLAVGSTEDAFKLARSYAAEQMRIVQIGADREDLLRAA